MAEPLEVRSSDPTKAAIAGISSVHEGIFGETSSDKNSAVVGFLRNNPKGLVNEGAAIHGKVENRNSKAGHFDGDVEIIGKIRGNLNVSGDILLTNADCAEDFDILEKNVEAGTVMVLSENGSLKPSYQEYDKKVAGIVSGASGYKPAIVLGRQQLDGKYEERRLPIALMGKVYCKVDARHSAIEIGDLLTSSSMKGCAMKAEDPMKAFGAVIGKALGSLKEGLGMIPVLVTLQ